MLAARQLKKLGKAGSLVFAEALEHSDWRVVNRALYSLGEMEQEAAAAVQAWCLLLDRPDGYTRLAVLHALTRIGVVDPIAMQLAYRLRDPHQGAAEYSFQIACQHGLDALPELEKAQSSSHWEARRSAVMAAYWIFVPHFSTNVGCLRLLRRALRDAHPEVANAALMGLLNANVATWDNLAIFMRRNGKFARYWRELRRFAFSEPDAGEIVAAVRERLRDPANKDLENDFRPLEWMGPAARAALP